MGTLKGIFSTLAALLLTASLLALAIPLAGQPLKNGKTASYVLETDLAAEKFAMLEMQAVRIISASINVSVSNDTVTVAERMPLDFSFAEDLDNLAAFERNFSGMNVSLDFTNCKNGAFGISPNSVSITHSAGAFRFIAQNSTQSAGSIREYRANLTFQAASADGASWDSLNTLPQGDPDGILVTVHLEDSGYALYMDFQETLDRSKVSRLNITRAGATVAYVEFAPPGSLEVYSTESAGLKALAAFKNPVYVEANDTISVSSFTNKSATVRIA